MANLFHRSEDQPTRPDLSFISHPQTRADQEKRDAMNVGVLRHPWIQSYITWQTGIAYTGQALRHRGNLENLRGSLISLGLGLGLTSFAISVHPGMVASSALLPLGEILTLGAMRNLRLPNRHQAGHNDLMVGFPLLNRLIGQTISSFLLLAPMSHYTKEHVSDPVLSHHRWQTLLTPGEASFEEIKELGFKPGASKTENWHHLWFELLLSPTYYVRVLGRSLRLTFLTGTAGERGFSIALWLLILTAATTTHNLALLLIAYGIPRVLFESAEIWRAVMEHNFIAPDSPVTRENYFKKTFNVILAVPLPDSLATARGWRRALALTTWAIRMISYIPARMIVLSGDMVLHGIHHIKPKASYANYEQERVNLMKRGIPIYSHWGVIAATDAFFASLEIQPRDLFDSPKE